MREVENSLDLNNLPDLEDAKQLQKDTSSPAGGCNKRKKNKCGGGGGGAAAQLEDQVYECRFCSLKFCKSQALGGHMNRHRQERETETLNKARQLVLNNDLAPVHLAYVSNGQPVPCHGGGYHHHPTRHDNMENAALLQRPQFRPMYPSRIFSTSPIISPSQPSPPPPPPAMYTYPYAFHAPGNDYFLGHALSYGTAAPNEMCNNYTCIGTPVTGGQGLQNAGGLGIRDMSQKLKDREEGPNWWGQMID